MVIISVPDGLKDFVVEAFFEESEELGNCLTELSVDKEVAAFLLESVDGFR